MRDIIFRNHFVDPKKIIKQYLFSKERKTLACTSRAPDKYLFVYMHKCKARGSSLDCPRVGPDPADPRVDLARPYKGQGQGQPLLVRVSPLALLFQI